MARLRRLIVALVALAPATPALAAGEVVHVIDPSGAVTAAAAGGAFAYPDDGSVVSVGSAGSDGTGAAIVQDVRLLGGRVTLARGVAGATPSLEGLTVDGAPQALGENGVIVLPGAGWLVTAQHALARLESGRTRETRVVLRLHLTAPAGGLAAGSEILIGEQRSATVNGGGDQVPPELVPIYHDAEAKYGVPWNVLAGINRVETVFGTNLSTSSAGAIGWMQFLPSTWESYGVDATGDGVADPYDPRDAIFSAANLLRANRADRDLRGAIWLYNHSWHYVDTVLSFAATYAGEAGGDTEAAASGEDDSAGYSPVALW